MRSVGRQLCGLYVRSERSIRLLLLFGVICATHRLVLTVADTVVDLVLILLA